MPTFYKTYDHNEPVEDGLYTYGDYLSWDDGKRYELHDGEAVMLASPSRDHQAVSLRLIEQLLAFLKGKPCKLFHAPFDVRLNPAEDEGDDTVFQPDLAVVCDSAKLGERACLGAPDFIIEILSPSTARYDRVYKRHKYREAGVREYWIVDPDRGTLETCVLKNGEYVTDAFDDTGSVPLRIFPDCVIDLKAVFAP
jgi:Uma2 family endonuclease